MFTLLNTGIEPRLPVKTGLILLGLLGLIKVREAVPSIRLAFDFSKATREAKEVNILRLSSRSLSLDRDIFLGAAF